MSLSIGQKSPSFKGIEQNGNPISLKDFLGKKLVIYFYPQDDTPTCTVQACNLRDHYGALLAKGISVVGISPDPVKKHKKFEEKYNLPFPLVADEDHSIAKKYEVWGPKKFMGKEYIGLHRTTFLIDETGKITSIITKPVTKNHAQQILEIWGMA